MIQGHAELFTSVSFNFIPITLPNQTDRQKINTNSSIVLIDKPMLDCISDVSDHFDVPFYLFGRRNKSLHKIVNLIIHKILAIYLVLGKVLHICPFILNIHQAGCWKTQYVCHSRKSGSPESFEKTGFLLPQE